jgi:hypothetical protein
MAASGTIFDGRASQSWSTELKVIDGDDTMGLVKEMRQEAVRKPHGQKCKHEGDPGAGRLPTKVLTLAHCCALPLLKNRAFFNGQ